MKSIIRNTAIAAVTIFLTFPVSANNISTDNSTKITKSKIVDNLLVGIKSTNEGLKLSALYNLGSYDIDKAVIELMRTLKDDSKDEARITAALSLYKLGDPRGIFAVKRAATFDISPRVRKMCEKYYQQFSITKKS